MIDAQDWYEGHRKGLGATFRTEIDHQVERIAAHPLHFPVARGDLRRSIVRRFPYGLFFRAMPNRIVVVACLHLSRDPPVWQNRS